MKKKDVIGIDVSKLTIDTYVKLAQVHAKFSNDNKGFRQLVKWIKKHTDCQIEELLICFETQNFPDAPNNKIFPTSILKPGEEYINETVIKFSVI